LVVAVFVGGSFGFGGAYMFYSPQINELTTDLDDLESQHQTLTEQYITLSGQHSNLLRQYDTLSQEYETLSQEYENLLTQYNEIKSSYEVLINRYEVLTGSIPLSPQPTSAETIEREYEWRYESSTWKLSLSIPESLYEYYKTLDRSFDEDFSVYVTHPYDDEYIDMIIEKFNSIAINKELTEVEKVNLVIAFVQSLPYTSDEVTTPFDEYPRYPLETLVDGGGDCEDTAILTAALLDAMNYDTVLLGLPGHMAVGVHIENGYGSYYSYNDREYFYLETTSEGWQIGELPDEYQGESAHIYHLIPVPILTHNWTATQTGFKITLEVTVKNLGSAMATGIKVYAAFDAGEDYVWNPEESEAFDLNIGRDVTLKLVLNVPENEYTRLIVGILDAEGYLVDVSYSEWFHT